MLQLLPRLLCICHIQRGLSFSHSLQSPRSQIYNTISSNLNAATNNNNGIVVEGGDNNDSDVLPEIPVLPTLRNDKTTKFIPPIFNNSKEETNSIKSTLMTNFMFQSLSDNTLDKLVLAFEKVEYNKGSIITKQGDKNIDYFYVIYKGECDVTVDGKKLPYPYGTLSEGTMFGELAMLYNVPRKATVSAKSDTITLFRVDRKTFRYFLDRQQPQEIDDVKQELKDIDRAIDKIAGVNSRYSGDIIKQYKPQRSWLWSRWTGTILQRSYKVALLQMIITASIGIFVRRSSSVKWPIGSVPDQSNLIISRMIAFSKHWHYLQGITTFILTFFLSQAYSHWREMYSAARKVQGRLNDINFLLTSIAKRDENGNYTPEAEKVLDNVSSYTRLFHAFLWSKFATKNFGVLSTARGQSRMLSRGLMTQGEFNALQAIDQRAGAPNACLQWIAIRALKGMKDKDGGLKDDESFLLHAKISELRGTYAGIGDILAGRMPLAYTHIVQILVDSFLATAPVALYAELGVWGPLSVGILTLFYSGLLDLAKIFLDPLDNDGFCNESINMDIGVLIREGNAGSTRWKSSAEILPF